MLHSKPAPTHFISTYAPDISKPKEEREIFFEQFQETLDKLSTNDRIFIMSDFNSISENTPIQDIVQRFNEDTINDNGDMLTTFCSQNELRINNTFYQHKWQHKYTFSNSRNQRSLIDYIITKKKTHPSQIMDVRTLASTNVSTEHDLVLCKYRLYVQLRKKSPTALR